jgi:hypothetical protein
VRTAFIIRVMSVTIDSYLCMDLCIVVRLNVHVAATFTDAAASSSLFIQHLKQPEPPRSLDGSGVLHVVELFSPLPV